MAKSTQEPPPALALPAAFAANLRASFRGVGEGLKTLVSGAANEGDGGRVVRLDLTSTPAALNPGVAGNVVTTSRYSIISFLPKYLFEAFQKFANTYFLIVSIFQLIPEISTTDGFPSSLVPLTVVVCFEGILSALEDRQRHRDDNRANAAITTVLVKGKAVTKKWRDVVVGDVVKIRNREAIPADCLVLCATDEPPAAVCYVETKSLDGETNLKLRQGLVHIAEAVDKLKQDPDVVREALAAGNDPFDHAVSKIHGAVRSELPNAHLDKFAGTARLATTSSIPEQGLPLTTKNMLLRGCVVRSTDAVYALVLNAGHDTKIMQSMVQTKAKFSTLDRTINRMLLGFVCVIISLSLLGSILSMNWINTNTWDDRFVPGVVTPRDFLVRACTFFLLVANMIPISLYVSLKVIRFCQSWFVYWDLEMVHCGEDPLSGEPFRHAAKVRTMDLNDTLGQISYVFSDKTGTLTNNVMEFRKLSVGGRAYGAGTTVIGVAAMEREGRTEEAKAALKEIRLSEAQPHPRYINFKDEAFSQKLASATPGMSSDPLCQFLTALGICHEVLLETIRDDNGKDTGMTRLSASSPDDQALVVAASQMGYRFAGRTNGGRTVLLEIGRASDYMLNRRAYEKAGSAEIAPPAGNVVPYELLETLEFTSTRKRMSVIVRDPRTREITLFCKGADSEIFKRLVNAKSAEAIATNDQITGFADDGLRTLTVASKTVSEQAYEEWAARYTQACGDLRELEKRKNKESNAIDDLMDEMETNLNLLGATAIEDKLQERVPETINILARAGIKIWVLTGDKQETAINIAWACQLIDHSMRTIIVSGAKSVEEMGLRLRDECSKLGRDPTAKPSTFDVDIMALKQTSQEPIALVIDGSALTYALAPENAVAFLCLACRCSAVVCCRVSPKQKALVVALCRDKLTYAKTLAIGDGANDVGMIQSAHVGVGISGLEGMQAVNAADFALGRFYYLRRLLLLHGRNNYRRSAKLVLLILYKNIFLIIAQIIFSHANGFSGQKIYFQWAVEGFNLVFTNLPVLLLGIYDKDIPDRYLLDIPGLYEMGLKDQAFNAYAFWAHVTAGLYHAVLGYLIMYFCVQAPYQQDMWQMGTVLVTLVIFVSNIKIALEQGSWHISNWIAWIFTQLTWPASAFFFQLTTWKHQRWGWEFADVFSEVLTSLNSWTVWLLMTFALLFRDYAWKAVKREFFPELRHICGEHAKLSGKDFWDKTPLSDAEIDYLTLKTQTQADPAESKAVEGKSVEVNADV